MADTLTEGQKLEKGGSLTSSNGAYTLTLQDDGNLVLAARGQAVWATGTNGQNAERLEVQEDGNCRALHAGQAGLAHRYQGREGRQARSAGRPQCGAVRQGRAGLVGEDGDRRAASARARGRGARRRSRGRGSTRTGTGAQRRPPTPRRRHRPRRPLPRTYTVVSGDTLWAISERFYGDGSKYQVIADASGVSNPDLIHPGQVLTIP